jgi:hypothetical protein
MNRFRKLGFIEYNDRIKVHKSMLDVVLHEEFAERQPEREILRHQLRKVDRSSPDATNA